MSCIVSTPSEGVYREYMMCGYYHEQEAFLGRASGLQDFGSRLTDRRSAAVRGWLSTVGKLGLELGWLNTINHEGMYDHRLPTSGSITRAR